MLFGCEIIPITPDKETLKTLNLETAKKTLKMNCPACKETTVDLSCDNGYYVDDAKTENAINYPYHDLVVICYAENMEIKGRQTDCISSSNSNKRKLPYIELKAIKGKELCNAAFSVINHYRELQGIGQWDYYSQKAMPEK